LFVGKKSLANSLVLEPCLRRILWQVYTNQVREREREREWEDGWQGEEKEEGVLWGMKARVYA
jgi:hypothetical protein